MIVLPFAPAESRERGSESRRRGGCRTLRAMKANVNVRIERISLPGTMNSGDARALRRAVSVAVEQQLARAAGNGPSVGRAMIPSVGRMVAAQIAERCTR